MITMVNGRHYFLVLLCTESIGIYPMDERGNLSRSISRIPNEKEYLDVAKTVILATQAMEQKKLERLAA